MKARARRWVPEEEPTTSRDGLTEQQNGVTETRSTSTGERPQMGERCQRRSARVVSVAATESAAGSAAVLVATMSIAGSAAMVVVWVVSGGTAVAVTPQVCGGMAGFCGEGRPGRKW